MSTRLQVMVGEADLDEFERTAEGLGLTLSEWVRQSLRSAAREVAIGGVDQRLAAIRAASRHSFPAPDIDEMLAEIEQGYATSDS